MTDSSVLGALQAESSRLIALLEAHGIAWRRPQSPADVSQDVERSRLSTQEKVALFRRLFRGRTDVYPIRWEGKTSGKSGYASACANEWRAGVREKLLLKCGDRGPPPCCGCGTSVSGLPRHKVSGGRKKPGG